ncbi:transporter [Desulfuromonas soudanensis]|uniref:Transporter n=1 Tax=Desulfuromonas soudanensis TaxID=1603606 RepID=A0A0M5IP73_9BACT|nr:BON domain-containing protein [Desulfuromonas soudanensis]ALC17761.1 transporter [Desulfuromonas soudanensis]
MNFNRLFRLVLCLGIGAIFLGCAGTPIGEWTGPCVDDPVITARIKAAIIREETLERLQIKVETFQGVVLLSGFVDSLKSVDRAEEVAASVAGVVSVKNDLVVKEKNFKSQI